MKFSFPRHYAFSLVEVTLALGLAAFCFVSIFGLLATGLNSSRVAIEQTAASAILSVVMADLRATPPPATSGAAAGQPVVSEQLRISIPTNPVTGATAGPTFYFNDAGVSSTTIAPDSRYRLIVTWEANTTTTGAATCANLEVNWPAQASALTPSGSVKAFVALDRN